MQALQFSLKEKKLGLVKLDIPTISDDEVLVKVAFAGVCGSDLHILRGEHPCNDKRPFTLGHEISGTVEATGKKVKSLQKGDKIAIDPCRCCGMCNYCRDGRINHCKEGGVNNYMGIIRNGGWAEYVSVPADEVYKLPDCITLKQGVLLEPISCLAHTWSLLMPMRPGQKVLVLGAGIIGNLCVSILHSQGHRDVIVSEPVEARRNLVKQLDTGFERVSPEELKCKNILFDIIIETSGRARAVAEAMNFLDCKGKVCLFGVASPEDKLCISAFDITAKEYQMFGGYLNPLSFVKAIDLMRSMGERYIDFKKLGVKTFSLENYKEALETLKKGTISKAVFQLQKC